MRKSSFIGILAAALVVIVAVVLFNRPTTATPEPFTPEPVATEEDIQSIGDNESATASNQKAATAIPNDAPATATMAAAPSAQAATTNDGLTGNTALIELKNGIASVSEDDALAAEFLKLGHSPQKVLDWSFDLGQVMLGALANQDKAAPTFNFLKDCLSDDQNASAYRAQCAVNAKRLAVKFPGLFGQEFAAAERRLPKELSDFLASE